MAKLSIPTLHYLLVRQSTDYLLKFLEKIIFFSKESQKLSLAITGDHAMGLLLVQSSPGAIQPFLL